MSQHKIYMERCLQLALLGAGAVSPNPMVGCVIVHNDRIIGEGWHMQYGQAHAEVNAIASVKDKSLIAESTVYVNLEPCSHHGKTPPCADLLISHRPKKVVIGMIDPFSKVAGKGVSKLKGAGIEVEIGILEEECKFLNRRFIKFHTKQLPYVILKWAKTINGYIAPDARLLSKEEFEEQRHITDRIVQKLVHRWRTQEDAIMVGTNTTLFDNPALNAREWEGRNPIRITLDKNSRLDTSLKLFDGSIPTIVFTEKKKESSKNLEFIQLNFDDDLMLNILKELYKKGIQSLIVEGGEQLLNSFINQDLWNEAIVFTSNKIISQGIPSPLFSGKLLQQDVIDNVLLSYYLHS